MEQDGEGPLTRVMALHALAYCERLFYLEEVEEIRVADERVFAGRTLHEELLGAEADEAKTFELESETTQSGGASGSEGDGRDRSSLTMSSVNEHQGVDPAFGDQTRGHNGRSERRRGRQHTDVVGQQCLGRGLVFR